MQARGGRGGEGSGGQAVVGETVVGVGEGGEEAMVTRSGSPMRRKRMRCREMDTTRGRGGGGERGGEGGGGGEEGAAVVDVAGGGQRRGVAAGT
ncbi:hypothetical protein CLOM_g4855 [Closterium sp. NIES-68]|nr:hypothetical protein CLOM_g4855 [Closterium sp. NIES-68]